MVSVDKSGTTPMQVVEDRAGFSGTFLFDRRGVSLTIRSIAFVSQYETR